MLSIEDALPFIGTTIVSFVLLFLYRFGRMERGSITGTVEIKGLQDGFEKLEKLIDKKESEYKDNFSRIWLRLEEQSTAIKLHEYRLNEKDRKNSGAAIR